MRPVISNVNGLHTPISQAPQHVSAVLSMSAMQDTNDVWSSPHHELGDSLVQYVTTPAFHYLLSISPYLPQTQLSREGVKWGCSWPDVCWMQVRVALAASVLILGVLRRLSIAPLACGGTAECMDGECMDACLWIACNGLVTAGIAPDRIALLGQTNSC